MMKSRLQFLKHLNNFRSKKFELQIVRETLKDVHLEFDIYHRKWCAENNVDLHKLNEKNSRKVDMMFIDNQTTKLRKSVIEEEKRDKIHDFKKIYRQVARKLHPDLLKDGDPRKYEYTESFKKATLAKEEGKWGDLFDIVDKHNIFIGEYSEAIDCLLLEIKRVDEEIKKEKSSYSWAFHEAQTKEQKDNVIKRFLRQLFGLNL